MWLKKTTLEGVFANNERGYRLAPKIIAFDHFQTSICCFYKDKIVKNDSY